MAESEPPEAIANLTVDYKIKTVIGVSEKGSFFVLLGWSLECECMQR